MTVYLDTGSGKHRQLIKIAELAESLGEDYCGTLLGFYVFSGEDCTSAYKGKGKMGPMKKLEKNPKYHSAFRKLGDDWNVSPQLLKELEQFTCLIYGQSRESSVDVVCHKLLIRSSFLSPNVDLARLPPCNSALRPHIQRVNHRVCLYKCADDPTVQKPQPCDEGQGWVMTPAGVLEP